MRPIFPRLLYRWITLGASFALLPGLGSCRPVSQREVSGIVLARTGAVEQTRANERHALTTEAWVPAGTRIVTGSGARLDLMLLPGVLVELEEATEIEIEQLLVSKKGDESITPMVSRQARIQLRRGTLYVSAGLTQARVRLLIITASGRLTVGAGRTFRIDVSEKATTVVNVRGQLRFEPTAGGKSEKLEPGFVAAWPDASEPRTIAGGNAELQGAARTILTAEKRLRRLEKKALRSLPSLPKVTAIPTP